MKLRKDYAYFAYRNKPANIHLGDIRIHRRGTEKRHGRFYTYFENNGNLYGMGLYGRTSIARGSQIHTACMKAIDRLQAEEQDQ